MGSILVSSTRRLLSFGAGFRSYFDGPESKHYLHSAFMLVWEGDQWEKGEKGEEEGDEGEGEGEEKGEGKRRKEEAKRDTTTDVST